MNADLTALPASIDLQPQLEGRCGPSSLYPLEVDEDTDGMQNRYRRLRRRVPCGPRTWPERGLRFDTSNYQLRIFGAVERDIELDWRALSSLPTRTTRADLNATMRRHRRPRSWSGASLLELLLTADISPEASRATVYSEGGYFARFDIDDLLRNAPVLAFEVDGRPLSRSDGGPVRLVLPRLAPWRSAKWVRGVGIEEERPKLRSRRWSRGVRPR